MGQSEVINVVTANLLNLALPNRVYYKNREPYSERDYEQKINWLAHKLKPLNADFIATQEVWDEAALQSLAKKIDTDFRQVAAPNAENHLAAQKNAGQQKQLAGGAENTPSVGYMSRLPVLAQQHFTALPEGFAVDIPELGVYDTFARSPLLVTVETRTGTQLQLLNVHLKSKRPKFVQDEQGKPLEDTDDPSVRARARLRSLFIRATEAAAIRHIIVEQLQHTHAPLVLMGDVNDSSRSVTTQLMAETSEVAYDRKSRDTALFNAYEYQTKHKLGRDVAYSHIFQGYPEVLDQIFVSEEFLPNSKYSIGEVLQVDYFNDYLKLPHNRRETDHGMVRARIKLGCVDNSYKK